MGPYSTAKQLLGICQSSLILMQLRQVIENRDQKLAIIRMIIFKDV